MFLSFMYQEESHTDLGFEPSLGKPGHHLTLAAVC